MDIGLINKRKFHLISIIFYENSTEAWQELKQLDPTCEELRQVMNCPDFEEEAWELLKQKNPSRGELEVIMRWFGKEREEATALFLQQEHLDKEGLDYAITYGDSTEAAKILLCQNPDKEQLSTIISNTDLADEAGSLLLNQNPDKDDLIKIIQYTKHKKEAWEKFLQQKPTNKELTEVIQYTDFFTEEAWEQLVKQKPTNEELFEFVYDWADSGANKEKVAAELIFKQNPDNNDLLNLILNDQLADKAWELLLQQSPESTDWNYLVCRGTAEVNEAAEFLLKSEPTKDELFNIIEHSDKKDIATEKLLHLPLTIEELKDIILQSNHHSGKAANLLSKQVNFDRSEVNESELIRLIAKQVVKAPDSLIVDRWHSEDAHCLVGWAITLFGKAKEVEKNYSSEIAGCLLLPHHTHLFYADRKTVFNALKRIMMNS